MTFLAVWSLIKGIAKAVPLWVWLILGVAIAFFAYGEYKDNRGYDRGSSERQALWDEASTKAAQEARATEDGWRKGITDYATKATQERLAREQETARIIDGLRTGAVSVRPRFHCPVSATPRPAPGDDGATPGPDEPAGFQASDAVVVLRIGDDADAVSERLAQCQNYVRTVAGSSGGSR